jgi:hypothetical protein
MSISTSQAPVRREEEVQCLRGFELLNCFGEVVVKDY